MHLPFSKYLVYFYFFLSCVFSHVYIRMWGYVHVWYAHMCGYVCSHVYMCMCVCTHMFVALEDQKTWKPLKLQLWVAHCGIWELKFSPLKEEQMLLTTEMSFQSPEQTLFSNTYRVFIKTQAITKDETTWVHFRGCRSHRSPPLGGPKLKTSKRKEPEETWRIWKLGTTFLNKINWSGRIRGNTEPENTKD